MFLILFFSQGCVYLYDSEGSIAELLDIHNADFVGIDCLTAGTQYCVVREWLCHSIFLSPRRVSSFLAWGDFHARSRFARSIVPEEKWGTTRSLGNSRQSWILDSMLWIPDS